MAEDFVVHAEFREAQGTGASRRLRHAGQVPAILYGGGEEPRMLSLNHNEVLKHLETEAFYSHILTIKVGDKEQQAVLKDVQRHPAKPRVMHMDFQRVMAGKPIHMHVPLHFINEKTAPGVKNGGGIVDHHCIDVAITCLPKHLPEYIEVDVGTLEIGDSIHLSEIVLPEGVTIDALQHGDDATVVSVIKPRAVVEEDTDTVDEAEGDSEAEGDESDDENGDS